MRKSIQILIADDHQMVREGLKTFMRPIPDFDVVGEASGGEEAISLTLRFLPDILLLDLLMPDMDGIQVIQDLRSKNVPVQFLMISSFARDEQVVAAIRAGAHGYLLKDSSPQELEIAIRQVARGESYLPSHIARKIVREIYSHGKIEEQMAPLTSREIEVLQLIANGMSNDEIAEKLFLSPWTVRSHLGRILKKLNVENRTQAAMAGLRAGIITMTQ